VTNSMGSGALVALKRDTVTDSLTIIQTIYNSIRPRYINRSWDNKLLCITGFDNFANATTLMFYEINNVTGMLIYLSTFQGGSRYDCKKCIDWNNRYMYTCPYFTDSIYIHQFDPFIDQELYVCNGESATLEAWGNYTSYLWSTGSTSPSITVNVPGNYYLTVQEANGNIYTDTVSVHIDSIPPVILGSDTTLYPGEYLFLDAGMNYTSYYWNVDNSTSQYMFLQNDSTFFGTTVVAVEVSNSNGCIAYDTILVTFSQGPNGIQTAGKTTISVYPNPFTSQAIINTGDLTGEMTLTIFDLSGQIVQETNYKNAKTIVISRNDLLSGLYFIRLKNDRNTFVSKLIVTDN
ncbi:MAG TPA: T9SS type A sorting domain-containing protein, partial [Bacteroidia bacterium]